MSDDEKRLCSKGCGRELGAANKSGVCSGCSKGYQPRSRRPSDDSVLSRMGFNVTPADEAPPATKRPRKVRESKLPSPPPPPWRDQFTSLASALGLDPEGMLETYCREWVETTRSRALAVTPPFSITEALSPRAEGT